MTIYCITNRLRSSFYVFIAIAFVYELRRAISNSNGASWKTK